MALPSSPPLLPARLRSSSPPPLPDDAAELPFRPSVRSAAHDGPSRKRQFSDYGSGLSSDPLFSEGTTEAEEEEDEGGPRRKRLVRGPWWNLGRDAGPSLRRSMTGREPLRNADSGVWMGSDTSDEGADGRRVGRQPSRGGREMRRAAVPSSSARPQPPTAEALVGRAITQCVEQGRETVDLSDAGLFDLSDSTLKPLHQLIRHSHADLTHPPSEDEFTTLTPEIKLFLSGNKLSSLPSELFRLATIAVLSLRNNELTELPPGIGRLKNLKELNIAQNNIRYLPWEMLELMHCRGEHRQINVRPNPLVDPTDLTGPSPMPRPQFDSGEYNEALSRWGETSGAFFEKMKGWYSEEGVDWGLRHELELRLKLGRLKFNMYMQEASRAGVELSTCNEQLIYLASSAVRFFEVDGSPCRTNIARRSTPESSRDLAVAEPLSRRPPGSDACAPVPSLFELALRAWQSSDNHREIPLGLPESLDDCFRRAIRGIVLGNESCSRCGTRYIVARAEWVEYWFNGFPAQDCLTREAVVPFLRRACSWACARPSELGAIKFGGEVG